MINFSLGNFHKDIPKEATMSSKIAVHLIIQFIPRMAS